MPLAGHAVVLLKDYWSYLANFGILFIYIISTGSYATSWAEVWQGMPTFLAGLVFITVFTQSSVSEERARREVERLVGELQDANQRLRQYATQVEDLAITKERNRLAREIHDGLGHYLTTIHMEIQAARAVMDKNPEGSRLMLEKAQLMTQEALTDVRRSVSALRESPEENQPLPELVANLMRSCETAGIASELKVQGSPRPLSAQANLTIFRSAQECINNVCKHSKASQVWVQLDYMDPTQFRMMVQDNGVGANTLDGGFGILGMRERVTLLNGSLNIQTGIDQGFRLEICIPS
jgi:signal transduction histidine kinase